MGMVASMACWKTFFVWSARARACMWGFVLGRSSWHGRTPGYLHTPTRSGPGRTMPTVQATTACFVLPPIRTFTVGPGISPGQPAAGCGRVADCNRRLGITPTPEHVPPSMHPPAEASHPASGVTPATARPVGQDVPMTEPRLLSEVADADWVGARLRPPPHAWGRVDSVVPTGFDVVVRVFHPAG